MTDRSHLLARQSLPPRVDPYPVATGNLTVESNDGFAAAANDTWHRGAVLVDPATPAAVGAWRRSSRFRYLTFQARTVIGILDRVVGSATAPESPGQPAAVAGRGLLDFDERIGPAVVAERSRRAELRPEFGDDPVVQADDRPAKSQPRFLP